jgi:hypothetical protein
MSLPARGLRVRLKGEAATQFACRIEASFVDASRLGPFGADVLCETANQAALEAFRIEFLPVDLPAAAGGNGQPASAHTTRAPAAVGTAP